MAVKPIPRQDVPVLNKDGTMATPWYQYFQSRETFRPNLSDLDDVSLTALANGQVLIWNSATGQYENGVN